MDLDDKAEHIRDILGSHAPDDQRRILHDLLAAVPLRSTPSVVSEEDYVRIFRNLLFSALFPHVGVPQPPWNLGITTRPLAWLWILRQMSDDILRDDWPRRACLPKLQECLQHALGTWAACEYPVHLSPRMLIQFNSLYSSISALCMRIQGWDFTPPPGCTDLAKDYIEAFYLNWHDDERRMRRELVDLKAADDSVVFGKDGIELPPPSLTGAVVPSVPTELHAHRPRMWCCSDIAQSSRDTEQEPETIPSATTPKRHREECPVSERMSDVSKRPHVESHVVIEHHYSVPPPQQGTRVDAPVAPDLDSTMNPAAAKTQPTESLSDKLTKLSMDIQRDDDAFIRRYRNLSSSEDVDRRSDAGFGPFTPLSLDLAINYCMHGWPDYETLFGKPNDTTLLLHGVFAEMPFANLDPKHVFVRDGTDPVMRALLEVKAEEVPQEAFRMCDGTLGLDTPLKGTGYRVWALPERTACPRSHEWSVGLRIGIPPSGTRIHDILSVSQTPPGLRKANFREALSFLQAPRQMGIPATQNTDANLGFAFYAYQSAPVVLPPGETHRHILLRVEGTTSRGGSGASMQKAKVGFCACCSKITHIAVPPSYVAGPFDKAKCTSTSLWQFAGPWANRFLAAHQYYNAYGSLSLHWDWAASTLDITSPSPLSLSNLHVNPTESTLPRTPLHADPSPRAPTTTPIDLSGSNPPASPMPSPSPLGDPPKAAAPPVSSPSPLGDPPRDTAPLPKWVQLSSFIPVVSPTASPADPVPLHARRDLTQFLVDDNSPPQSRPLCSDGRNLSVISQTNFPRGGHRVDSTPSPSVKGERPSSNRTTKGTSTPGNSDTQLPSPLHVTVPLVSSSPPAGPISGVPKGSLYGKPVESSMKGKQPKPKGEIHVLGKGEPQVPRKWTNGKQQEGR